MLKKSTYLLIGVVLSSIVLGGAAQFSPQSSVEPEFSVSTQYIQFASNAEPIATEADFQKMRDNLDGNFILTNDIQLQEEFVPIGDENNSFTGIFEGNDKSISNLRIQRQTEDYVGFFGQIGGEGIVRNFSFELAPGTKENPSIHGEDFTGALAGKSEGIIEDVHVLGGYVRGGERVGGLIGNTFGGSITASYATGDVSGNNHIGGLIGFNDDDSRIFKSAATGNVSGDDYVGGLIGHNSYGDITMSYTTGDVSGINNTGGLVGNTLTSSIITSSATGDVLGEENVGGLVGYGASSNRITDSHALGNVSGMDNVGGLVGYKDSSTISTSYAAGAVTGIENVGGLVGYAAHSNITDNYATGNVAGEFRVGGLVGRSFRGNITASYAGGEVSGEDRVGGLVGDNYSANSITKCYFGVNLTEQRQGVGGGEFNTKEVTPYYTTENTVRTDHSMRASVITQSDFHDWDFAEVWMWVGDGQWPEFISRENSIVNNTPTTNPETEFIILHTEADFRNIEDDLDANYFLANDISLTGNFEPLGDKDAPFTGIFEGNNKTISNLKIMKQGETHVGLFRSIGREGTVYDLSLELAPGTKENPSIHGEDFVGALAGKSNGKIENVRVLGGYVRGNRYVGGLIGVYDYGNIISSYTTGAVTGGENVGGLLGYNSSGRIITSYATGTVTGNENVGGLLGLNSSGRITTSYATGAVTGDENVGGLLGLNSSGRITTSYATGAVTGGENVGGLLGFSLFSSITTNYATGTVTGGENVGGLVGSVFSGSKITNSYVVGTVAGKYHVGGLVGYNVGKIITSYTKGNITGDENVGGLVGSNSYHGSITNSYAVRTVKGRYYTGGLVGNNSGKITASYATGAVSGNSYIGGLVGYSEDNSLIRGYFDVNLTGQRRGVGGGTFDIQGIIRYYTIDGLVRVKNDATAAIIMRRDFRQRDSTTSWKWEEDGHWPLLAWQEGD